MSRENWTSLEACTQPQCVLRDEAADPDWIAELIVRVVSGEELSDTVPADRLIARQQRCLGCVRNVLQQRGPLPTVQELERILDGRRAYRRLRRRRQREERGAASRPITTSFY